MVRQTFPSQTFPSLFKDIQRKIITSERYLIPNAVRPPLSLDQNELIGIRLPHPTFWIEVHLDGIVIGALFEKNEQDIRVFLVYNNQIFDIAFNEMGYAGVRYRSIMDLVPDNFSDDELLSDGWEQSLYLLYHVKLLMNNEACNVSSPIRQRLPYRRGQPMRFMRYREVTVKANRSVVLPNSPSMVTGIRKAAHTVMGHWAHSRLRFPPSPDCQHVYVPVNGFEKQEKCSKCGHLRWFKVAHQRGDGSLGYIVQERRVVMPGPD